MEKFHTQTSYTTMNLVYSWFQQCSACSRKFTAFNLLRNSIHLSLSCLYYNGSSLHIGLQNADIQTNQYFAFTHNKRARNFAGAGYEGLEGLIETLTLFTSAGTAEFVEKYPNLCKPFSELYSSSMDFIRHGIEEGALKGNWGEDYTEKAEELMELCNARRQVFLAKS